jgi:3-oxoacyl-[acyl-carrier protein] reductase
MSPSTSFASERVLITGAAAGIGLAIARAFGSEGDLLILNDRDQDRIERVRSNFVEAGIRCVAAPADVRDRRQTTEAIELTALEHGAPTIVVANAGVYPNTPFLEMSAEEWELVLDTNLNGVFLTFQAAARAMIAEDIRGHLITISSGAANNAIWGWSHYCASKAAAVMLTRSMALELGEHGIRANAILPGYIDVETGGAHLSQTYRDGARTSNPLSRPGTSEDIANAVLMLASPLAAFVNGAVLAVDGGASAGRIGLRPVSD